MQNLWLYPVSGQSGYSFDGRPDTSLKSFADMIETGGGDGPWSVRANAQAVRSGDGVVIYEAQTRDSPPLIIGTGTVSGAAEWHSKWRTHTIEVKLNRPECKRLAEFPIDATYLKDRLPSRKSAVVNLPTGLRRWIRSNLDVQSHFRPSAREALEQLRSQTKTVRVKGRTYEAVLRHDPRVIAPLKRRLRCAGWRILAGYADGISTDLVALNERGTRLLLVEGKTIGSKAGRIEIRYAIGQLLDYEYFFVPTLKLPSAKCDRLILLERKPDPRFIVWAESLSFGLAWMAGRKIFGGPLALKMLRTIA